MPLRIMIENRPITGIISIDATECGIGITDGNTWRHLETITSGVQGKSSKGGSSARRYERNREAELNTYFHRVAEHANNLLLKYNLVSLIISGPAFTKVEFLKKEYLDYRLKDKVGMYDNEYSGFEGILQTFKYVQSI
jgi:peptide chain release factor subunit 1